MYSANSPVLTFWEEKENSRGLKETRETRRHQLKTWGRSIAICKRIPGIQLHKDAIGPVAFATLLF